MYFQREYLHSTRAATQAINVSDVNSLYENSLTCLTFQKPGTQNQLNRSYLLVSIGIMFTIVIILSIIYLWLTYKAKRRSKIKRRMQIGAGNANPNSHLPLDTVYHNMWMWRTYANETEFKSFKEIWKIITSIEGQKLPMINFKKTQNNASS